MRIANFATLPVRIWLCLCLLLAARSWARPANLMSYQEMCREADLVAIIRPLATTNATDDMLFLVGKRIGTGNSDDYRAMNTRCQVLNVLRTSYGLNHWASNELVILHFRYAPNIPEFNGGCFMYFDYPPTEIWSMVKGKWQYPIAVESMPKYLAFLKRHKDGRFIPVTGHYDSELSFRVLSIPSGGAIRYFARDGLEVPKTNGTNMPSQYGWQKHKLDDSFNLVVRQDAKEHRVVVEIVSVEAGIPETTRSFTVANGMLGYESVQKVKLDPASDESQYFIQITKQNVNYGAVVGMIAYHLKEWELLMVPEDSIEIVETNGRHELKCQRIQKNTYILSQGVLKEK